jgi:hypothetical protein
MKNFIKGIGIFANFMVLLIWYISKERPEDWYITLMILLVCGFMALV